MLRAKIQITTLTLCVLSAASASLAQPAQQPTPPSQPAQSPQQAARRAYDEGSAHFQAGRVAEALTSFRRAYELSPHPVVLIPIIECHNRLDQVPEAIEAIERYLRDSPANAPNRAALENRLAELRRRPARVRVISSPTSARITLDGRDTSQRTPADLEVTTGRHIISLSMDGYVNASREIDATPGSQRSEEINLSRQPAGSDGNAPPPTGPTTGPVTPDPPSRGPSAGFWITVAAGSAALTAGTVFGILALMDANSYDQQPDEQTLYRGERYAVLSDIGFGTAALAATLAVVVYFAGRERPAAARPAHTSVTHREPLRWSLAPNGFAVNF